MKLLINICAHDGIISHYTGVGTMVKRYIKTITKLLEADNIEYELNLFTPEYNEDSFGYSSSTKKEHEKLTIYQVSNDSNAAVNYGTKSHWDKLCQNTAKIINNLYNNYDRIITIAHDTPFACLQNYLTTDIKHKTFWIPHSTIKIHQVDSAIPNSELFYNERLLWEETAINFINVNTNSYLGGIGNFIKKHLIEEYGLKSDKVIDIYNGEILTESINNKFKTENQMLFKELENEEEIVISFGRAEEYKNLEATMHLGKELNMPTVIIAQSYYKEQPILERYRKLAEETNTKLYIDPPFDFAKYILCNFNKKIILVVPSKKEIMGLIINEIRKLKKDNILLVANNIDGLNEQIQDGIDGVLVDLDNIVASSKKIKENYNEEKMKSLCVLGWNRLNKDYNFEKNCEEFLKRIGVI